MRIFGAAHSAAYAGLPIGMAVLLLLLIVWSVAWKGLALWRAARRNEKIWFVVLLLVNTAGLLEIIYLFFVTSAKLSDFTPSKAKRGALRD